MFRIRENEIADALTTADIWRIMLREVPPIAAEYFIGGADELTTLKANVLAFQQTMLAPHGAIKHQTLNTTTSIFGQELSLPFFSRRWGAFACYGQWLTQLHLKSPGNLERP